MTRKFDRDCFHCFEEQICRSTTFGGKARWEVQSLGLQNHSSKARMYSKAIQSRCSCSSIYIINCTVHHSLACCLAGTEFGLDLIAHSCCLTTEVSWWRNVKKLQTSVIVTWALAEICRMPIFCPVTSDIQYHSTYISTPFLILNTVSRPGPILAVECAWYSRLAFLGWVCVLMSFVDLLDQYDTNVVFTAWTCQDSQRQVECYLAISELTLTQPSLLEFWNPRHGFLLGCSFTWEDLLAEAQLTPRHVEADHFISYLLLLHMSVSTQYSFCKHKQCWS